MTNGNLHCWEFTDCPNKICSECVVFKVKSDRCWEFTDTQCSKILGFSYSCEDCRYYQAKALKDAKGTLPRVHGGSPQDADGGSAARRDSDELDGDG
ncbi:MAG TPA: hypothetical protein VM118_05005 [Acidobacteriota bacterium]|nr:hypothetical protein [Acidobacteriota bacterium]